MPRDREALLFNEVCARFVRKVLLPSRFGMLVDGPLQVEELIRKCPASALEMSYQRWR